MYCTAGVAGRPSLYATKSDRIFVEYLASSGQAAISRFFECSARARDLHDDGDDTDDMAAVAVTDGRTNGQTYLARASPRGFWKQTRRGRERCPSVRGHN